MKVLKTNSPIVFSKWFVLQEWSTWVVGRLARILFSEIVEISNVTSELWAILVRMETIKILEKSIFQFHNLGFSSQIENVKSNQECFYCSQFGKMRSKYIYFWDKDVVEGPECQRPEGQIQAHTLGVFFPVLQTLQIISIFPQKYYSKIQKHSSLLCLQGYNFSLIMFSSGQLLKS